jgi:ubiquinone/menaquinone biosynthesis C-methylase UbiE
VLRAGGRRKPQDLNPPIELITANNVGIHDKENVLDEYKRIGIYVATTLQNRAGLRPESDVLDVGCGTGRVAIPLTEYLTTGSYTGIDVVKSSIEWCQSAFRNFENFRFVHADLYSKFYNPDASMTAEEYIFPFDRESFDVIWSSSLFTHMLMPAVDNYLKEMARVAKPGGRIWNSYLLLDEISEPLVLGPRNDGRRMQHEVEGGRIAYKEKPEHVVGLYKEQIMALHEKHGFEISEVQLSNWSGGRPDTKYRGQDVIIARKN